VQLPKKLRRFAPRLTAGSYKFFTRGMNNKPSVNDVVLRAQRRVQLKPYDKLLKGFRCASISCRASHRRTPFLANRESLAGLHKSSC
jgi:hypothetical protein